MRELGAAGTAIFHPDHQEVHVSSLALRSGEIDWRTAPGSETAIQYGSDRIEVTAGETLELRLDARRKKLVVERHVVASKPRKD